METIAIYSIENVQYELYKAASNDYCVTVSKYGAEDESYNLGTKESALEFILSSYECDTEEEE